MKSDAVFVDGIRWNGDDTALMRARQRKVITRERLEGLLLTTAHPYSTIAVIEFAMPRLQDLTLDALEYLVNLLEDGDPHLREVFLEIGKRESYQIRTRPGSILDTLLCFLRKHTLSSHAVTAWNAALCASMWHTGGIRADYDIAAFSDHITRLKAVLA